MQPKEIVEFWGWDDLVRGPAGVLRDVAIPDKSKRFLTEVGLPSVVDKTLVFGREGDQLPRLGDGGHYRRIGFDDYAPICLDERRDGAVVCAASLIDSIDYYMNCDVQHLCECLIYYMKLTQIQDDLKGLRSDLPEEEDMPFVIETERVVRDVDPTSF